MWEAFFFLHQLLILQNLALGRKMVLRVIINWSGIVD